MHIFLTNILFTIAPVNRERKKGEILMKQKRMHFKMPTSITTLLILTFVIAAFTFVIPAGEYAYVDGTPVAGTYQLTEANPQGLWDVVSAPVTGFKEAIDVILFIVVLGGCLGVLFETRAIDAALSGTVKRLEGREKIMIPIIMMICSIGGTVYGMAEETIAFYPIIMPILLAAGYDVITGIMVVFLGAGIGVCGGLINPFSVGIASNLAGISLADGMAVRLVLYIAYLIFGVAFVMRYAEKVRKNPEKSIVYDIREIVEKPFRKAISDDIPEFTKKRKHVISIFGIMFLIMIIAIIPWSYKFNIQIFQNMHDFIKGVPVLGVLIGNILPLGDWYFQEMTILFFIGAVLIGKVYGMKEGKIVECFIAGCKDILGVAVTLAVAKGISVIMTNGCIIGTILHWGEMFLSGLSGTIFPALTYLVYVPLSFLIPSSSGLATATIPILAPMGEFIGVGKEYIVMACQAGSQTMNFISPTQAVLVGALTLANVPYERWLKHILPFFIGILLITVLVITGGNILI